MAPTELDFELLPRHPDYITSEDKDILIIGLYANDPSNPIPRKQLTFKHLAAIKKASLIKENFPKDDIKIGNPQDYERRVSILVYFIDNLNHYDRKYTRLVLGIKEYSTEMRKQYVLDCLREIVPSTTKTQVDMGYLLANFLETLKGGLILERDYLERLKDQYQIVPDDIKKDFGLQSL